MEGNANLLEFRVFIAWSAEPGKSRSECPLYSKLFFNYFPVFGTNYNLKTRRTEAIKKMCWTAWLIHDKQVKEVKKKKKLQESEVAKNTRISSSFERNTVHARYICFVIPFLVWQIFRFLPATNRYTIQTPPKEADAKLFFLKSLPSIYIAIISYIYGIIISFQESTGTHWTH